MLYSADVIDKIVAVVNDDIITQSELEESMLPFVADYKVRYGEEEFLDKIDEARADALNRLIEEKLILHEAKRIEVTVEDEEVEFRLERVKSNFTTEAEFYKALEASGVTPAKLKQKYREQIMMRKMVNELINSRVTINPTDIATYYHGNQQDFATPPTVNFKILLLKPLPERNMQQTEALALKIIDRIKAGEGFDGLVKEYSQGPNIDKGGEMGYMAADGIIKELGETLSKMQPGDVSGIIRTSSGFNIVKLIDAKDAATNTLDEATDVIRERLFQREAELTMREFVAKLKKDAYIDIK